MLNINLDKVATSLHFIIKNIVIIITIIILKDIIHMAIIKAINLDSISKVIM